jgi:cell division protein FtsI/penicillin-binding protein 2
MKDSRLKLVVILFLVAGGLMIARLFYLQIFRYNYYHQQAEKSRSVERVIDAKRGEIRDMNNYLLATNLKSYSLVAVPANVTDAEAMTTSLATILNINPDDQDEFGALVKILSRKDDFYKILKKDLTTEEAQEIKELAMPGLFIETGLRRNYPENDLFSHVIGFLGYNGEKNAGQYGIEESFDKDLAGTFGLINYERTPSGSLILDSQKIIQQPKDGVDVFLTLDRSVQYASCRALAEGVQKAQAASGSVIIMEPATGKILALCNYPNFNPNSYQKVTNYQDFYNSAISEAYEPGSVFKIFTMGAALDTGNVASTSTYVDTGEVKIGGYTIKNSDLKAHGVMTMTNVLEKSLNTGAVFAARKVGLAMFRTYVKNFGFAALTGVEQPGEAVGDISNLNKTADIYLATGSFGQGISATTVQLLAATGAIANQGKLMKPYLVDKIVKNDGSTIVNQPKFIRQVISSATATTLSAMMVSVLENGYGKLARVPNYWVAGKTGTAQAASSQGGYSTETIHTFVGFVPNDNPKIVGVVKINYPKIGNFAESTAAPIFGKIADYVLKYYNVPPNRVK